MNGMDKIKVAIVELLDYTHELRISGRVGGDVQFDYEFDFVDDRVIDHSYNLVTRIDEKNDSEKTTTIDEFIATLLHSLEAEHIKIIKAIGDDNDNKT